MKQNGIPLERLNRLKYLAIALFAFFALRLWHLQVISGNYYEKLAEQNRVRTIPLRAPRGIIRDREGRPLVINRPSFTVYLVRENLVDLSATLDFLARGLELEKEEIARQLEKYSGQPPFYPAPLKENLSVRELAYLTAHQLEHPEIRISLEPRRHYPYGRLAAHLLGYVGEVSEDELARGEFPGARPGTIVGKFGLERRYNQILTGIDGSRRVIVTSAGREVELLEKHEPIIGGELQLTIDLDLQLAAERLLDGKAGTIVALDPRSGEILAMASHPAFDPNSFALRISQREWTRLITDPAHPLQNRAIQSRFSPGSVFKIVVALAALEERLISPGFSVYCNGGASIYGHYFRCHKPRHGRVDLESAIINSCNVFFYRLGQYLGIERIARYAQALGLGEKTGIDLPEEVAGFFPTPEWKLRSRGEKWYAGETISVAIGQGPVTVTPLQLARAIGIIATRGLRPPSRLVLAAESAPAGHKQFSLRASASSANGRLSFSEESYQALIRGMWGVVNQHGTGRAAAVEGFEVCGKTGTAQVISNEGKARSRHKDNFKDHAWFVGFAPRHDPEIVVAVLIEGGGFGGQTSAPIAGEIFREYFKKRRQAGVTTVSE